MTSVSRNAISSDGSVRPAVETVGDEEQGKAQKGRDRSVIHDGPAVGADSLNGQDAGGHAPRAGQERPRLDVIEVREGDGLKELEGPCRHQPRETPRRRPQFPETEPHTKRRRETSETPRSVSLVTPGTSGAPRCTERH